MLVAATVIRYCGDLVWLFFERNIRPVQPAAVAVLEDFRCIKLPAQFLLFIDRKQPRRVLCVRLGRLLRVPRKVLRDSIRTILAVAIFQGRSRLRTCWSGRTLWRREEKDGGLLEVRACDGNGDFRSRR